MFNKIIAIILFTLAANVVTADTVQINPDHPEKYVVQKGDTLWDIAGRFLTEPWRWPEIWKVNPQIENPHLIYPGDVVALSFTEDESPVLTVDRDTSGSAVVTESASYSRDVKLSPRVREYEREDAIPLIPIDSISQFLTRPIVISENEMEDWPYVVTSYEQHLIAGSGNKIYIRGLGSASDNTQYSIYRKGPAYIKKSNGNKQVLGYEAIYVGDVTIEKFGNPATGIVTRTNREILKGDKLAPLRTQDVNSDFVPRSPDNQVRGSIISVIDGLSEIGQYQVVVVDLGETDGLEVGNVLGVYQKGDVAVDKLTNDTEGTKDSTLVDYLGKPKAKGEEVQLPEEYAGVIMVFRTFSRVSYALVMRASLPFHLDDKVRNL